jgi:hypothetical protein
VEKSLVIKIIIVKFGTSTGNAYIYDLFGKNQVIGPTAFTVVV